MKNTIIECKNVTKRYGSARGVANINLQVPKGQVFGFLGPNGAGKTTTISMLVDFIRPTEGSVKIFGQEVAEHSVDILRNVGFLAGDMALDRGLTARQQLAYFANIRGNVDWQYVESLATRLECSLDRKFKHLSRGNKQKVGLIAALMHKPELLILDEPTSGLDPLMQAEFNAILLEHKAQGKTAFVSSHSLSEVQEICDSVTFIKDGALITTKPMADIATESPKRFSITGASKKLIAQLHAVTGLQIDAPAGKNISGTYSGDINVLLQLIAKHPVADFNLQSADLESTFMKYYEHADVK